MRLNNFLNEENIVIKTLKSLKNKSYSAVEKIFKDSWMEFSKTITDHDKKKGTSLESNVLKLINKSYGTNYKSLEKVGKMKIMESDMNEDFKHFWEMVKMEGFPILSFWPGLQVWLQIDKLIRGSGFDMKTVIIYALLWAALVSGKFVRSWDKWKKENPEEFEKEGGKKNPFSIKGI